MNGRCQCGVVRFHTDLPKPTLVLVCHCLECRWQSASSYGLSAMFPATGVHFTADSKTNMTYWSRTTTAGQEKQCWFCKVCGTRLYHHCPGQKTFTVKAGSLEGFSRGMLDGAVHIWAKRAITPTPEGVKVYDEEMPEEVN